jgi:L-ascorbate metabolism protein UlaG (beta-lactamase superfamily)
MIKVGRLHVTPLGHGSLLLKYSDIVIHVDPYSEAADYNDMPKADQIWITHEHFDHLDRAAIDLIRRPETQFLVPPSAIDQMGAPAQMHVLRNGEHTCIGDIKIKAVAAYNAVRERSPGVKYHPRGLGNGYVATFDDQRIYICGDSEFIPEMKGLKDIDLAIIPVMLPYTMSPQEAVQAVQSFTPRQVLAYHTTPEAAQEFAKLLKTSAPDIKIVGQR